MLVKGKLAITKRSLNKFTMYSLVGDKLSNISGAFVATRRRRSSSEQSAKTAATADHSHLYFTQLLLFLID